MWSSITGGLLQASFPPHALVLGQSAALGASHCQVRHLVDKSIAHRGRSSEAFGVLGCLSCFGQSGFMHQTSGFGAESHAVKSMGPMGHGPNSNLSHERVLVLHAPRL